MTMRYFIADWEDRLDPKFDFATDTYSREKGIAYETDVYAHQLFKTPPYDGVLISLATFDGGKLPLQKSNNGELNLRGRKTIKGYLRVKRPLQVMGDCGAFTYVNEERPPRQFSTKRVADLYSALRFDFGVSVDHMTPEFVMRRNKRGALRKVRLTDEEKEKRRQLSLKNARDFLSYCREKNYRFTPIGAAQGMNPSTYADSVHRLLKMGYSYIGLGTLIPRSDGEIISILKAVAVVVGKLLGDQKAKVKLHLFGVLRRKKLKEFAELGVASFDSASYLRKAWLRSGQNYLTKEGLWYAAIRVPYFDNPQLVKNAKKQNISGEELKKMETRCLNALRSFDKRRLSLKQTLSLVMPYDELLLRDFDGNHHRDKYRKTLKARPWEKCQCEVCRKLGIDVVLFRGCNRNKRRGFHNTKMFYDAIRND